jgi:hypothetical protein
VPQCGDARDELAFVNLEARQRDDALKSFDAGVGDASRRHDEFAQSRRVSKAANVCDWRPRQVELLQRGDTSQLGDAGVSQRRRSRHQFPQRTTPREQAKVVDATVEQNHSLQRGYLFKALDRRGVHITVTDDDLSQNGAAKKASDLVAQVRIIAVPLRHFAYLILR